MVMVVVVVWWTRDASFLSLLHKFGTGIFSHGVDGSIRTDGTLLLLSWGGNLMDGQRGSALYSFSQISYHI